MEKNDFQQKQGSVNDFFSIFKKCIESEPSENTCQLILEGALQIARAIEDPVLADNFEAKWKEVKKKIKVYADATTFRLHEIEIEKVLQKILAPARAEL